MKFPPSFLDEIKARIPVSQVVSRKVKLTRRGREFVGLSPFNAEKTPSFTVNDTKGFYHCFSSGKHGDIFGFLTEVEGLSFPEAVEQLAGEAGVPMPERTHDDVVREERRAGLIEIMEMATQFFERQLQDPVGRLRAAISPIGVWPRQPRRPFVWAMPGATAMRSRPI